VRDHPDEWLYDLYMGPRETEGTYAIGAEVESVS
jgi:hypothetical protein